MRSSDPGKVAGIVVGANGRALSTFGRSPRGCFISMLMGMCLLLFLLTATSAWGQIASDDGFGEITQRQTDPFDRINEALQRYGRIFLWVGIGLSAVVMLKIVAPVQL